MPHRSAQRKSDKMTLGPDSIAYPPRGMSRDEAARYVGVGATKFDEMVADHRMPRPKRVDGRPDDARVNPLDRMLRGEGK